MKSDHEKLPTRFLRRMTASYRRGRSSQSSLEGRSTDAKDQPAMASTRTESDAQGPPAVPARTTSRPTQEHKLPTLPPKSRRPVDHFAAQEEVVGSAPVVSPNDISKRSDFEVIDTDKAANDTDSAVSIDEHLPPLPPLPIFKGYGSPNPPSHDSRTRISRKGVSEVEYNPNPRPGPSIIQKSRVIDLPVEKGPSPKEPGNESQAGTGTRSSWDTSTPRRGYEGSNAKPASRPSSSKEAQTLNPPIFIPKIPALSPTISPPENVSSLAAGLDGNYVDEFGNILDWHGHVLGRVEGDLPSMVGRPISSTGEVLDTEGRVVGFVAENYVLEAKDEPKPIEGFAGSGLRVDHSGNILDSNGSIVGRMKKNNAPDSEAAPAASTSSTPPPEAPGSEKQEPCSCGKAKQTKPSAAPSPSEIYLDVKSTNDGIQLIIKIPTIFNRDPVVQILNT